MNHFLAIYLLCAQTAPMNSKLCLQHIDNCMEVEREDSEYLVAQNKCYDELAGWLLEVRPDVFFRGSADE